MVAGNYPRNLLPEETPELMTAERWLNAQQETEHKIMPEEVSNRKFLGIILDRTLGYKPDAAFTAVTSLTAGDLATRTAVDAWEKKGVREFPAMANELIKVILEHSDLKRHVPPGFGAAILELVSVGGTQALDMLNHEGRLNGAPLIEYRLHA